MNLDNLQDTDGRPITLQEKPGLDFLGIFEGLVTFKLYVNAIEGEGKCIHCGGVVKQLVRLAKSDEILNTDPYQHEKVDSAKQAFFAAIKGHHFCPVLQDGKLDSDEWLKRFN